ncbi:hypothetical protein JIN85_13780 [Luteolibacter pohnpeiensis]|uniref:Glycine zipper domain-containing protein n=1 Tax=Luteolibacter pohnpeiensis TaxID=454153 RepID=A0A934VVF0_9BACT|nr:hypothetical protein [Luteolibacter pohnpeiensis]MBK1883492.1 hypothetical protein [Luteolibacter pohnpeiensis]
MQRIIYPAAAGLLLLLASCSPYQQQGAGLGALGGGALGAIAGDSSADVVRGAAIGAAVGTGVAAYQENQQRRAGDVYGQGGAYGSNDSYRSDVPTSRPDSSRYPVAEKTVKPNIVLSPYPPYNEVDVSGFASGQYVKDPTTSDHKIFRVP